MPKSRVVPFLALVLACLSGGLVVAPVATAVPPAPEDLVPRWCSTDPAPCLVSASRNGVDVPSTSTDWQIRQTAGLSDIGYPYFQWQVVAVGGTPLTTSDDWSLTFDTGTIEPRYTEGYSGTPVVQRSSDGDGTWHVTYTASPVLTTTGCTSDFPPVCPHTADSWQIELSGEVQAKPDGAFNGFDVGQSVDEVNGIFLEEAPDGTRYLSSEMANSHVYVDGGTSKVFTGQVRWRIPYAMLTEEFGVPNPKTMVASSLSGAVTRPDGTASPATFSVVNDTVGKAMVVDVSGVTFTRKVLQVRRGVITPTRPTQVSASRTSKHKGFVDFDPSSPRGAKVTGYLGRCVAVRGDDVRTASSDNIVRFTGLREGKPYDCKVRALSAAGPSKWSESVRMTAGITNPF